MKSDLRRTPLHSVHVELGARFTEFGGWEMPVQYTSIMAEHRTVRSTVGLFDLSHMGEIAVRGPRAAEVIQQLITNDLAKMQDGKALYSPICNPTGGVVDDLLVYRLDVQDYLLVVNAANTQKDWEWVQEVNAGRADLENESETTALLAIQGPQSQAILERLTSADLDRLYYYECLQTDVAGIPILLSRTGYTGEDGFELYVSAEAAGTLWLALYELIEAAGGVAVGLGARDTLRLEMGYPLYGHELTEETTPLQAGLAWTVALRKSEFIGQQALLKQSEEGISTRLVGFEMLDRGVAREGYPIFLEDHTIGHVTSGAPSPSLNKSIGMAYVPVRHARSGQPIFIEIHRRLRKAVTTKLPFHRSSVRRRQHAV